MPLLDLYEKLRELEISLDKAVLKKKLSNEESHHKRLKISKRIRLFIKYTKYDDSYHLQVDGQVIGDFADHSNFKITDVFKNVVVRLNSDKESNSNSIFEWNKKISDNFDMLELNGTENHNSIEILFDFENTFDKYKLSSDLQHVLDKETETKTGVLIDLWKYIRLNRLIADYTNYMVKCDEKLQKLFKTDSFQLLELVELIDDHLLPLDPLIVQFDSTKDFTRNFDVPIDLDDFFDFPVLYKSNFIFQLDQKIHNLFESAKAIRNKIKILTEFNENPSKYINDWIIKNGISLRKQHFELNHKTFYDPLVQQTIFEMMQYYKK